VGAAETAGYGVAFGCPRGGLILGHGGSFGCGWGWSAVALRRPVGSASALPECLWRCHPFPSSANIGKSTRQARFYIALFREKATLLGERERKRLGEQEKRKTAERSADLVGDEALKARIKELEEELEWAKEELELELVSARPQGKSLPARLSWAEPGARN
jgi:hypothetical protein